MILYDLSFSSPLENIACDEFLLQRMQKDGGEDVLRLWESPVACVVLGMGGKIDEDVNVEACRRDGVQILRRSSGGGTVLQGKGCLNFCFVFAKDKNPAFNDLHQSYREILSPVIAMFSGLGVDVRFHPTSDLALVATNKKISGNAQRRLKNAILHHGTVLYDFDLSLLEKYLRIPVRAPEYRAGRSHADFVENVSLNAGQIRQGFKDYFPASRVVTALDPDEKSELHCMIGKCRERFIV